MEEPCSPSLVFNVHQIEVQIVYFLTIWYSEFACCVCQVKLKWSCDLYYYVLSHEGVENNNGQNFDFSQEQITLIDKGWICPQCHIRKIFRISTP